MNYSLPAMGQYCLMWWMKMRMKDIFNLVGYGNYTYHCHLVWWQPECCGILLCKATQPYSEVTSRIGNIKFPDLTSSKDQVLSIRYQVLDISFPDLEIILNLLGT